jgi:hypothetical protein
MTDAARYLVNEQGDRIGIVLDLDHYQRLVNPLATDPDCLIGISPEELNALANCKLAPADQAHLDDLLAKQAEAQLSAGEITQLDQLLAQADALTLLKTRARYTLQRQNQPAQAS